MFMDREVANYFLPVTLLSFLSVLADINLSCKIVKRYTRVVLNVQTLPKGHYFVHDGLTIARPSLI